MSDKKMCKRCEEHPANRGEKYCGRCRGIVVKEMKDKGYLEPSFQRAQFGSDERGRKELSERAIDGCAEMLGVNDAS